MHTTVSFWVSTWRIQWLVLHTPCVDLGWTWCETSPYQPAKKIDTSSDPTIKPIFKMVLQRFIHTKQNTARIQPAKCCWRAPYLYFKWVRIFRRLRHDSYSVQTFSQFSRRIIVEVVMSCGLFLCSQLPCVLKCITICRLSSNNLQGPNDMPIVIRISSKAKRLDTSEATRNLSDISVDCVEGSYLHAQIHCETIRTSGST